MNAIAPVRNTPHGSPGPDLWPAAGKNVSVLSEPFRNSHAEYLALALSKPNSSPRTRVRPIQSPPPTDFTVQRLLSCAMLCRWGILPQAERDGADAELLPDVPGFDRILVKLQAAGSRDMTATMLIRRAGPRREWSRGLADRLPPPRLSTFVLRCYYRALR